MLLVQSPEFAFAVISVARCCHKGRLPRRAHDPTVTKTATIATGVIVTVPWIECIADMGVAALKQTANHEPTVVNAVRVSGDKTHMVIFGDASYYFALIW